MRKQDSHSQSSATGFALVARSHRLLRRMAFWVGLLPLLIVGHASASDYRLGLFDKLTIRVVDWPSGTSAFREWPALTGEFTIALSGNLSLPFAGEVKAEGRTTQEVAEEISTIVQRKFGLVDTPVASVDVLEFRPVVVGGRVQTPGRYAFEPEMTVLTAISLAGGMRQPTSSDQRFERDYLNAKGARDVLIAERQRQLIRIARLEAELGQKDTFVVTDEVTASGGLPELVNQEKELMQARLESLSLRRSALEEAKSLYQSEVTSLSKRRDTQSRQMDLIKAELDRTGKLAEQRLVVTSRVLGLELTATDTEDNLLDIDTATVRAKQEMSRLGSDLVRLDNDHKAELLEELKQTKAAVKDNELRIEMYAGLIIEALVNAPAAANLADARGEDMYQYIIMRTKSGETAEISANEKTRLQPGDLVKVSLIGTGLPLKRQTSLK